MQKVEALYCYTCGNSCGTNCAIDSGPGAQCLTANCVIGNCFDYYNATHCSDGSYICGGSCPSAPPTQPGGYCGDGICNNGENGCTCSSDHCGQCTYQPQCSWNPNRPSPCTPDGVNRGYQDGHPTRPSCCDGLQEGGDGTCGCPSCTASNPTSPTLISPISGTQLPSNNASLQWSDNGSSWGTGCPSNNNQYKVFLSAGCTSTYTQASNPIFDSHIGTTFTKNVTNLAWGTTYCWYVQKNNGSRQANSQVWNFSTNHAPTQTSSAFTHADTCTLSNGISGRFGNPNVENPITYTIGYQDTESDTFVTSYLVLVPTSGAWGENNNLVDPGTLYQKSVNARAFGIALDGANMYVLQNNLTWNGTSTSGSDLTNQAGTGTAIGALTSSKLTTSGNTSLTDFTIKFENTFPTGTYNLYSLIVTQNSDGTLVGSNATPTQAFPFKKVATWTVDTTNPGSVIGGPTFNSNGSFRLDWTPSDNVGVSQVTSTVASNVGGARLTDQTTPPRTFALTPTPQNAFYTATTAGSRTYLPIGATALYTFVMNVTDAACNTSQSNVPINYPGPWLVSYQGSISATSGYSKVVIPNISNFIVPFTTDNGIPYLSTYGATSNDSTVAGVQTSKTNIYSTKYINKAAAPPIESGYTTWYDYISNTVTKNAKSPITNIATATTLTAGGNLSTKLGVAPGSKVIFSYGSTLTIGAGVTCDIRAIILVAGTLRISPDFLVSSKTNGCMFVGKGNSVIDAGTLKTVGVPVNSPILAGYDEVDAFIITNNNLNTALDNSPGGSNKWDGLYLNGGMIAGSLSLLRDINHNANATQPSHEFRYDPRYDQIFRDDLATRFYSIREVLN